MTDDEHWPTEPPRYPGVYRMTDGITKVTGYAYRDFRTMRLIYTTPEQARQRAEGKL